MSDSGKTGSRPKRIRFLLDRRSQLTIAWQVVGVLAGVGLLYAVAVYFLVGSDIVREGSLGDMRILLLCVHALYFLLGGAILLVVTLLITHRFVGPAYVMKNAIAEMRRGRYDARLSTRTRDFHKDLSEELRLLQSELEAGAVRRADLLARLAQCLDEGRIEAAGELIAQLTSEVAPAETSPRAAASLPST
ncbi:MAG: hypothetical protein QNJ98_20020 [Planctomycetota bacterium]|nr:hypothetical protein [Planctomycetota bacterium]